MGMGMGRVSLIFIARIVQIRGVSRPYLCDGGWACLREITVLNILRNYLERVSYPCCKNLSYVLTS